MKWQQMARNVIQFQGFYVQFAGVTN